MEIIVFVDLFEVISPFLVSIPSEATALFTRKTMRPAQARADVLEVVIPRQENYDQNQEYYLLDSAHPCRILVYFF